MSSDVTLIRAEREKKNFLQQHTCALHLFITNIAVIDLFHNEI